MKPPSFRRVFVVGAYMPDGGTLMAYHLGRILENDFGVQSFAVTLGDERPDPRVCEYDLAMPIVPREEMERQITPEDILIVNPGFSRFHFGWRLPGFKISYVQGFGQFRLLDRRLDHFVAVSDFVGQFLKSVYEIQARVIPPFVTLDTLPSVPDWSLRPEAIVLPYRKGIPEVWDLSFRFLQQTLATRAPQILLSEPLVGPLPKAELLARIGSVRYLLTLSSVEGFGLVPLEAMALGTLVVGYDGFGGRHYMRSGENCAVAPYPQIEQVADLLVGVASEPTRALAMVRRAKATAEGFSYTAFRNAWIEEFSAVLNMDPIRGSRR